MTLSVSLSLLSDFITFTHLLVCQSGYFACSVTHTLSYCSLSAVSMCVSSVGQSVSVSLCGHLQLTVCMSSSCASVYVNCSVDHSSHTHILTHTRRMSLVHKRLLRTCVHLFSDFDGVVIFQITACCRRCQTRRWWRIL